MLICFKRIVIAHKKDQKKAILWGGFVMINCVAHESYQETNNHGDDKRIPNWTVLELSRDYKLNK